ncbi:carbohydrate esterase family 12 protein [Xylariaceae sp. FL0594]|nr:carbohydrate esterase family 12 protein [Xylariaceae sp. FL0594]
MGTSQIKSSLVLAATTSVLAAASLIHPPPPLRKPPAFFLAGDSTTAPDGGWGNGVLGPLVDPAWGVNVGQSGATTASYVAAGKWANVTAYVREYAKTYDCYVTISFGHNDQKPQNNVSFDTYQQNLINFAKEVEELGGTALLTSSLARRVFPDDPHNATDSLHEERLAAIRAAANVTGSSIIDLNAASLEYVDAIGRDAAWAYNWGPSDYTHLNPRGEAVFGRMVVDLITRARPELRSWFAPNRTLSYALRHGLPA